MNEPKRCNDDSTYGKNKEVKLQAKPPPIFLTMTIAGFQPKGGEGLGISRRPHKHDR